MKIERYFSVLVIVMAGLFLLSVSWPEPIYAAGKTSKETRVKAAQIAYMQSATRGTNLIKPRLAQAQAPTVPTCVQCWNVPVNTWSVPATSGAAAPGTVCTICVPFTTAPAGSWNVPATAGGTGQTMSPPPAQPVASPAAVTSAPACPVVRPADTPWGFLGSILQAPFVLGQCIFGACPAAGC
jgi:hypothetical protein